jgi:hypothetical protein
MTDPLPDGNAVQDTTLPDVPTTTALAEKDGWKTVEGKAAQKKRRDQKHHTATATPPPAFATTSTETMDFSIGFGFAVHIYVSL